MDRLESITAFVAVAKASGFSAASREIGVPLPTVSRRVAELEEHLGVRLLRRSTRHVALTEEGQTFCRACEQLLGDLKDAEEAVTGEYRVPKGDLVITAPLGFGRLNLQPIALEFLHAYPEINLRLMLGDRVVDLVEEHIDLALRIAPLSDSSMVARHIGHVRMVVSASPEYLGARGTPLDPDELIAHDCIAWSTIGPSDQWGLQRENRIRDFPIHTRLSTTSADSAIAAAEAGLGLAQTTCYQAERSVREGKLVIVLQEFEPPLTPVHLVYASNRMVPLKLRTFIDFMMPRLVNRLQEISRTLETRGRVMAP
jgi:DNA-binding transcriptional LysR family regulator